MSEHTLLRIVETTEDTIADLPIYEIADENNCQDYFITDSLNIRKDTLEHLPIIGHFCLYLHNVHQRCINIYEIKGMKYILNSDLHGVE